MDDDGESVKLTFGTNLPTGVTEGTTKETVISITDDDVPSVEVEFGAATYSVEESDDSSTTETKENEVVVTVKLSADPERTVTIPIVKANQGGASNADYSGIPDNVVFNGDAGVVGAAGIPSWSVLTMGMVTVRSGSADSLTVTTTSFSLVSVVLESSDSSTL